MLNKVVIEEFGLRIRQLRKEKNISQERLGLDTGFHRTYIGMLERGERNISLNHIAVFARYFEMNISELLDFSSVVESSSFKNYSLKNEG